MNKRIISVLGFALVISVLASVVLYRLIAAKLTASAKPATTQLVVASHDLGLGTLIKDTDIKVVDWSGPQPKTAVMSPADAVGRGVIAAINDGEPIVETRLAPKGAGAGLASIIPPGMRVDLLIAGTPPGAANQNLGTLEKTLLQNIEVLSAGQNIQKDAEGKPVTVPVVNLLVTPEQAEILSLATNETRIQLVLRNPMDKETVKTPGTAIANLFSGQTGLPVKANPPKRNFRPVSMTKPTAVPAAPEPQRVIIPLTVEVITGVTRTEMKFKPEEAKH